MINRKIELRKWFLDHPDVNAHVLAEEFGRTARTVYHYLYHVKSAPSDFLAACRRVGIPDELLPALKLSKAELLAENARLEAELARLRECA
ncbi:hypothetical protein [Pseudodesulfovibrio pelocollis]|uniref:hypothetical protein n=1 Tax=Pseudodesulfovibrio pelocollis TaxID=3051432 RepID=UPI00255B0C93|nr:hypothetical protein [Pseudodesulfovibrio sp. SB368]